MNFQNNLQTRKYESIRYICKCARSGSSWSVKQLKCDFGRLQLFLSFFSSTFSLMVIKLTACHCDKTTIVAKRSRVTTRKHQRSIEMLTLRSLFVASSWSPQYVTINFAVALMSSCSHTFENQADISQSHTPLFPCYIWQTTWSPENETKNDNLGWRNFT